MSTPSSFQADSRKPKVTVQIDPSDSTEYPKHVYLNITAQNISQTEGVPAVYQVDFDFPYLKNAEKYYLSIVKAQLPTTSIYLFKFVAGTYTITITTKFGTVTTTVRPFNNQNPSGYTTGLQYIYGYQQFLDAVNIAIIDAFNQALINIPGFSGNASNPPYVVYNASNHLFSIVAQSGVWTPDLAFQEGGANLIFNTSLWTLFNSIPAQPIVTTDFWVMQIATKSSEDLIGNGVNPILTGTLSKFVDYTYSLNNTYYPGDVVYVPQFGGIYYAAIQLSTGNPPATSPLFWRAQGATNPSLWAVGTTYVQAQLVNYPTASSDLFISRIAANTGNTPTPGASTAQWLWLSSGAPTVWTPLTTYVIGQNVYYPSANSTIWTSTANANTGNFPGNTTTPIFWVPSTAFDSIVVPGEFSTLPKWAAFEGMVIQSGSLPIRYEVWPATYAAQVYPQTTPGGQTNPRPIVTDFTLTKTPTGFDRTPLLYVPPGNYRMVDMFSKGELKRIDTQIQWLDKFQVFHDLIMYPGDFFSVKYLFLRNDAVNLA